MGAYLGDGYYCKHPRAYELRFFCHRNQHNVKNKIRKSLGALFVDNKIGLVESKSSLCDEICLHNQHIPEIFGCEGAGRKDERILMLFDWQREIMKEEPWFFLMGLIDTDGCRYIQTVNNKYRYEYYQFTNKSTCILDMCGETLDLLGIENRLTSKKQMMLKIFILEKIKH